MLRPGPGDRDGGGGEGEDDGGDAAAAEGDQGGGDECESMTADECSAAGGMVADAPSCLPDPCAPSADQTIVCCLPCGRAASVGSAYGGPARST